MTERLDFSLPVLKKLLIECKGAGYQIRNFSQHWEAAPTLGGQKVLLLRHDVDRFPDMAVATAEIEAELGLSGTYFFRTRRAVMRPSAIKRISDLGHEIGYHYECLADANGDYDRAFELVERDLKSLRKLSHVVSASMHSRPFSPYDGRTLWDRRGLSEFGLKGEAYRSIDHGKFLYLADSGRNWGGNRNVVWDTVNGLRAPEIQSTNGLIEHLRAGDFSDIQLLIHPNRWPATLAGWTSQFCMDWAINSVKTCIKYSRSAMRAQRIESEP